MNPTKETPGMDTGLDPLLFRLGFEHSRDIIMIIRRVDGRILEANISAMSAYGYTHQEMLDLTINDLRTPETHMFTEDMMARADAEGVLFETLHRRKDGSTFTGKSKEELELRVRERTAELELMNKELQDFTFIASHDLKEPLRKIQAFGDLVVTKDGGSLKREGLDYLYRMQDAAARMQELLQSLLSYSRLTTKLGVLSRVDLNEVARNAVSNLEIRIKETGALVEIGDLPSLEGDDTQLVQLFQNLFWNALKFHRQNESPRVKVYSKYMQNSRSGAGVYEILVEDNGIGFDEKYLDKVFLPFQRLHGRDEYEGVGMGLAICKKIVERHGGVITARSTPGKGSTFIVTLPGKQP